MNQLKHVTTGDLVKVQDTPLILYVETPSIPVERWIEAHQAEIGRLLLENGALLLRGLRFLGSTQLAKVLGTLFGANLLPYTFRSTPRTHFKGNIYTATEYHCSETIPQHNENSYSNRWPLWIGFMCVSEPSEGGRTPIANSSLVYQRIPARIRDKFEARRVSYTRNYGVVDLPWTEVFQTKSREEVEGYCKENNILFEWTGKAGLRTRYVGEATAIHPMTRQRVWFNQAHLFHITNLSEEQRGAVLAGEPPRNAHYGDGAEIDVEDLDCIRKAYDETVLSFAWKKGDLLLLDNMRFSHGREPYSGPRKILCGMGGTHGAS